MAFQRSYSKVWWGSEKQLTINNSTVGSKDDINNSFGGHSSYFGQTQQQQPSTHQYLQSHSGYQSLDLNNFRGYNGNLSRIQEVDDEQNMSRLSARSAPGAWEKHNSPGSLRSQDSGFSDNDESHSTRSLRGGSSKTALPSTPSLCNIQCTDSPASIRSEVAITPPTVIRRVRKSEFYSPVVNISRRISFTGPSSTNLDGDDINNNDSIKVSDKQRCVLLKQLNETCSLHSSSSSDNVEEDHNSLKRRRRVMRRSTKLMITNCCESNVQELKSDLSSDCTPMYNNETIYDEWLSSPPPAYNNETVVLGDINSCMMSPLLHDASSYMVQTSTPKRYCVSPIANSFLQKQPSPLTEWLDHLHMSYEYEVMSTLQTKSIAQQAIQNLTITTNTVTKLIRQLQQRSIGLQSEFDRIERQLMSGNMIDGALQLALVSTEHLLDHVDEFLLVLRRRAIFFESRVEHRRYDDCLEKLRIIVKDTRYSLDHQHYISLESLIDDVQVMRRHLLFALRMVFEHMVLVIVHRIESGHCELMLRANLNMIATLSNIDYKGFASLTDAFIQCGTVRVLLIVCLEHGNSAVRAQALRALATVCCVPEAIAQLGCDGIEILRDVLQAPMIISSRSSNIYAGSMKRRKTLEPGIAERREAVSLLTQITADWHGADHHVDGLHECIEPIVEGLTRMIAEANCSQTLLLCAAALNNLSRIEVTSHYSIMSNEAVFRLIETAEQKEDEITIFFYEQVVTMLHNMSLNKKCHSHLANASIINFITSTYLAHFYKIYESRAESESQKRTVKAVLHTLTRLVHDSNLGVNLLAQQGGVPAILRLTNNSTVSAAADLSQLHAEISLLARDLLDVQREDKWRLHNDTAGNEAAVDCGDEITIKTIGPSSDLKFKIGQKESYV